VIIDLRDQARHSERDGDATLGSSGAAQFENGLFGDALDPAMRLLHPRWKHRREENRGCPRCG
jgi:hypothetical protein